jgi:hypothetical protein
MNPDFVDLLRAFIAADVRFLIVGAYALALHGRPRATGDLDIWIEATPENATRVMRALRTFGAPTQDIDESDLARPGVTYQLGVAPVRIDILTELTAVRFEEAWPERRRGRFGDVDVDFAARSASEANDSGRIVSATSRFSRVSRARYTSPMPPAPSRPVTSYGPIRAPISRAIRLWRKLRGDYAGGVAESASFLRDGPGFRREPARHSSCETTM